MLESLQPSSSKKEPKSPAPKVQLQNPSPAALKTRKLPDELKSPKYSSLASTNKVISVGALTQAAPIIIEQTPEKVSRVGDGLFATEAEYPADDFALLNSTALKNEQFTLQKPRPGYKWKSKL